MNPHARVFVCSAVSVVLLVHIVIGMLAAVGRFMQLLSSMTVFACYFCGIIPFFTCDSIISLAKAMYAVWPRMGDKSHLTTIQVMKLHADGVFLHPTVCLHSAALNFLDII